MPGMFVNAGPLFGRAKEAYPHIKAAASDRAAIFKPAPLLDRLRAKNILSRAQAWSCCGMDTPYLYHCYRATGM
jgi:hypothetical protein